MQIVAAAMVTTDQARWGPNIGHLRRSVGTGILGLGLGGAVSFWYTRQEKEKGPEVVFALCWTSQTRSCAADRAAGETPAVVHHHCMKYGELMLAPA